MIEPALLRGRDHYERVTTARVDNTHDDAFTHVVHLEDPERALDVEIVATPSPDYAIPAAARAVDGVIEAARLARQVAKLPPERAARAASRDPWECWQLDRAGWVDLPDSCFTYSETGARLFGTRPISTPIHPELYRPRPGQRGVFERRKIARLERRDGRRLLFHPMHDNVHGFALPLEIDAASAPVVGADHAAPRLPYRGLCDEPQRKFTALLGEHVDDDLRRRIQVHLGGPTGCAQLYDLTADLLKLLAARG